VLALLGRQPRDSNIDTADKSDSCTQVPVRESLADTSRRRLLDSLNARNGQSLRELCAGLTMARQSVSKHLAVLEAANLVTTVWRGQTLLETGETLPAGPDPVRQSEKTPQP
jgi:DNA-binding transcriptional ArsR family regulator